MKYWKVFIGKLALGCGVLAGGPVWAEAAVDYPSKPVTVIVPFSAGGGTDATVRVFAKYFEKITGQSMVVDNRPGGGTLVGAAALKSRPADGYTLGVLTRALHVGYWLNKDTTQIDPLKDFTYIAATHGSVFGLLANSNGGVTTVEDVIKAARENPGKISIGNIGVGTTHHLVGLELASMAGIDVLHIPYKGEADSNAAVMGGHVDLGVSSGSFIPLVQGGKLKVIALALQERLPEYPDWPTFKELGHDIEVSTLVGLGGPADMDPALVERIDGIVREITSDPGFREDLMRLYQPVTYVGHEAYTTSQVEQNRKELELMKKHGLIK